jgi:endonuclease/exonuclease/phosphatase family metal-dependent hydrolase
MRIITYNLHKGRRRDRYARRQSILEDAVHALADRQPDILLCQEVYHGVEEDVKQCHFITEVIGHDHIFGPNAHYRRGCHGNATFAHLPVDNHRNIDATESFFEKRGILHTTLRADHGPIDLLNVHFSLTGRQRRRQWFKLVDALPKDPTIPTLVAGDFNDWAGSLDRRAKRSGLLENAMWALPRRMRRSFPATLPLLALDRIYFRHFHLHSVEVLRSKPWRLLSDHLPLEVELEVDLESIAAAGTVTPAGSVGG